MNVTDDLSNTLVYLVSPRGGDNFWARVINGTHKIFDPSEGTLSVSFNTRDRYTLRVHEPFYRSASPQLRRLGLVHEGGHLAQRHLERLFYMFSRTSDPFLRSAILSVANVASDFAVNDSAVRLEPEFDRVHRRLGSVKGEWHFLLPREYGLPSGLSLENYIHLILEDPEAVAKIMQQAADEMGQRGEEGAAVDVPGDGRSFAPSDDPLVDAIAEAASGAAGAFQVLQESFDRLTRANHAPWNKEAQEGTPDEAQNMASEARKDAREHVKSALDQSSKGIGHLPYSIRAEITDLLEIPPLPWEEILQDHVEGSIPAKMEESMATPNLMLLHDKNYSPWPGLSLNMAFNVTVVKDSSASRDDHVWRKTCAVVNQLMEQNKSMVVTLIECDTIIQNEEQADNIGLNPEPKTFSRHGRGGTDYVPAFKRILNIDTPSDWAPGASRVEGEHPAPDLLLVCTDGGLYIEGHLLPNYHPGCPIIWIVDSDGHVARGMSNVPPDRIVWVE